MNVLDLFSGIGGFSLGLERAGMRTVAFCEIDPYCRAVLARRWPGVPCYNDIRGLSAKRLARDGIIVNAVCGGFPCQDISGAGEKAGLDGKQSGLWFEYLRLIRQLRPDYVIVENVADLLHRGLGTILGNLAAIGYDAEWHCIPASYVGLPQARDRLWIVAYPNQRGLETGYERHQARPLFARWFDDDRLVEAQTAAQACTARAWRIDDGVPRWVDRIATLGNAVVPQIPEIIGRAIMRASNS